MLNAEPVAKVGEEFIYSNAGYAIAAAVCEAATGVDWETAIADMFAGVDIKMGLGWPATLNSDGPGDIGSSTGTMFLMIPPMPTNWRAGSPRPAMCTCQRPK